MNIKVIREPIPRSEVEVMAKSLFGDMVKGVVDIERKTLVLDMELHADGEMYLLENGSKQSDLWGINLHPGKPDDQFVEFDSMINIRPSQNNRSRSVEDPAIQQKVIDVVNNLIN
jgi:hypothetical protein